MLILGIDPGSNATGYGLIESRAGRLKALTFGTISPPRGLTIYERLPHLFSALEALLEKTRPDEAAVEDLFHARNARSALILGHARGVILLALCQHGLAPASYSALTIKQAVTGNGRADKEQVQKMIRLLLSLPEVPQADASDALAVALCHGQSYGVPRS